MKNHQWVLEPFANMIYSLCITDNRLKKDTKMKNEVKSSENMEIFRLSLSQQ